MVERPRGSKLIKEFRKSLYYYILALLPVTYIIIFRYVPMAGNLIAFRRYLPGGSIFGQTWVGSMYFKIFMNDPTFWRAFSNTLEISLINLIFGFPIPIILALMLNEVRKLPFKKFVQTVTYLPRFLSLVVIIGLLNQLLSPSTGIINGILKSLGKEPIHFLASAGWFLPIYIISGIWQNAGWNAIIYIAALAGIDIQLYEAAEIDGAGKLQKLWHITLPGISSTIMITFILAVGGLLSLGFEKVLLLYNPMTYETADIISTYVYRIGIEQGNYSYATAIGLFNALIGLFLVATANFISRKFSETSLW